MEATIFKNTTKIEKLTAEVLVNLASFLNASSILQLSLTCKTFRHLIKDDLVFRRLAERDYRVTAKPSTEPSWLQYYKDLKSGTVANGDENTADSGEKDQQQETVAKQSDKNESPIHEEKETIEQDNAKAANNNMTAKESACPHLGDPSDLTIEVKRVLYRNNKNEDDKAMCDLCHLDHAVYLNMHHDTHIEACLSCLKNNTENNDNYYPIQLELETGDLYCFKCGDPRKLMIEEDGPKVKSIVEYINAPESEEDLDKRRKAEHQLYVQELRREDMSLKFYLVEKQWGRTWMLFRTREGSPLPTKITNQKLARANGTLDPNIRLPMDKYRPSPETHGDIVSEKLWGYLSKVYGVQGRAYSEDDIIAPEYARLRVYVDDFKKSIYLYP